MKAIFFFAAFLSLAWALSEFSSESTTSGFHINCVATLLPIENQRGFKGAVTHHIQRAIEKGNEEGRHLNEEMVRIAALRMSENRVSTSGSPEQFLKQTKERMRECAGY
ncbi:MAG: hypothetical protein RIE87_16705 [Rhodospirillales bacterium]